MSSLIRGLALSLMTALPASADTVRVAVATEVAGAAEALAAAFESDGQHIVELTADSTGTLYDALRGGAAYDVFLAGDRVHPARLLEQGMALKGTSYAAGRLVLIAPTGALAEGPEAALVPDTDVVIGDPGLSPFGGAALEALRGLEIDPDGLELMLAETVDRAADLFLADIAPYAILPLSLLPRVYAAREVDFQVIDPALHSPVILDAVEMGRALDSVGADAFMVFLNSPEAAEILESEGFASPGPVAAR